MAGLLAIYAGAQTWRANKARTEATKSANDATKSANDAETQTKKAVEARKEAENNLADMHTYGGLIAADMHTYGGVVAGERGDPAQAVLWFANAASLARNDPLRQQANRVRVRTWGRQVLMPVRAMRHPDGGLKQIAFHRDGRHLLVLGRLNHSMIWDLDRDRPLPWATGDPPVTSACWSPDGLTVALGMLSGRVEIRRFPSGELLHLTRVNHPGPVDALSFSPNGASLAIGSGVVRVWDLRTKAFSGAELLHPRPVSALAFNPRGDRLVTGCLDNRVRVFDVSVGGKTEPLFAPSRTNPILHPPH